MNTTDRPNRLDPKNEIILLAFVLFLFIYFWVFNYTLFGLALNFKLTFIENQIYQKILPKDLDIRIQLKEEFSRLVELRDAVHQAETESKKIDVNKVRKYLQKSSRITKKISKTIVVVVISVLAIVLLKVEIQYIQSIKKRNNKNIYILENIKKRKKIDDPVDLFLAIVSPYLEQTVIDIVRRKPNVKNITDAFSLVRAQINFPSNLAARCFPKGDPRRYALLDYGRQKKIRFQNSEVTVANNDVCNNKEISEKGGGENVQ